MSPPRLTAPYPPRRVVSSLLPLALLLGCGHSSLDDREPEPTDPGALCTEFSQRTAGARLLTRSEYLRTIQDLLSTDLDPTGSFPSEPVVGGFNNDATSHQANPLLVEKHAQAASLLAAEALKRGMDTLHECKKDQPDVACASEFLLSFGRRAFRRPLTENEADSFRRLYDRASPTLGHQEALGTIVEAMLASPQFLYRIESPLSEASAEGRAEGANITQLGPFELASRLSYFLWGSMPDEELLLAAEESALSTRAQVEAQAQRLLQNDRAKSRVREFHVQWLKLDRLSSIARNGAPQGLAASLQESTLRFLDRVFWSEGSRVSDLYGSPRIYYDDVLRDLYDLPESDSGWTGFSDPDHRFGLLTQPGLMALHAHANQSSPIQRGVFVREHILCEPVEPPPPTVDNNPPDPDPNLTTRELFSVHTQSPACKNCHALIDPLGFGFERYDHLGRYRSEENGIEIDASGELVDLEESSLEGPFADARELSEKIADSDTALTCLARKWYTFALGRAASGQDDCSIEDAARRASYEDGSLRELLVAITGSVGFRYRPALPEEREVP